MPRGLPNTIKKCLCKAQDSALLAVETYNKPAIKFKSGGYIVLMVISWTALFHAIFFRRKINPYYKQPDGRRYLRIEGDYKYWELHTCIEKYYKTDTQNPVRKNLEFFIRLRNKTEHKSLPEIDPDIFGECQSMLFNFDKLIEKEFGLKYCIREALTFSLQMFPSYGNFSSAVKLNSATASVKQFIDRYRSTITTDIIESGQYSFKAFLFQVSNHETKEALPVQFIAYDKLTEEQKHNTKRVAALIKEKINEVPVLNLKLIKPGEVVKKVQVGLGNKKVAKNGKQRDLFVMDTHTRCWKKYNIRPDSSSENPKKTNKKYCVYDEPHDDYLYTNEWVTFLVSKLTDDNELKSLY